MEFSTDGTSLRPKISISIGFYYELRVHLLMAEKPLSFILRGKEKCLFWDN